MIDKPTIARIFDTADIVDVIGEFVNLKKAGQNFKALSPFTDEKTPSFFVSPSKQIFKCFSSGKGGNVVTFLMEHEKLSYPEALKYLAKKYNIEIIEHEVTEEDKQLKDERESLLAVSTYAQKYFTENLLKTDEGKSIGLGYFIERGYRDDIIKKFQLGYSREQRDAFSKTAIQKGYKLDFLLKTGLTIQKGDYRFDRFHGRVMFPIHSLSGQVIGFGGRILKKDEKTAKYLNSPESDIYHKSHILYGLYYGKQAIVKQDKCYLVEGYTDVLSMHQAGIENVVASSGTSLTPEQIRLIKRFTKHITVIYDGDEAGIKASLRGIDLVLEEGLNIKVVLLPEGEDPDSFAKANESDEFLDFIQKNETDFITFKTRLLLEEAKTDPVKKATLISDIVKSIAVIPDSITRTVYIRECSKMMDIDEKVVYAEIRKRRRLKAQQNFKKAGYQEQLPEIEPANKQQIQLDVDQYLIEKEIIRLLLNYGNEKAIQVITGEKTEYTVSVTEYIIREIDDDDLDFNDASYKYIYEEIKRFYLEKSEWDEAHFIRHHENTIANRCVDLLSTTYQLSEIWKKKEAYVETENMKLQEIVPEAINAFKNQKVLTLIKEVEEQLTQAQQNNDEENIVLLQQRYIILNELKKNLSKNLGDRIVI